MSDSPKIITGYCEPWSLRSGEKITLFSSSHSPGPADLSLVRIECGDPTSYGPGFSQEEIASDLPSRVELADQPLRPGSYATVDLQDLRATDQIKLSFSLLATCPEEPQTLAWLETSRGYVAIVLDSGLICADVQGTHTPLRSQPLANRRWYERNRCPHQIPIERHKSRLAGQSEASALPLAPSLRMSLFIHGSANFGVVSDVFMLWT